MASSQQRPAIKQSSNPFIFLILIWLFKTLIKAVLYGILLQCYIKFTGSEKKRAEGSVVGFSVSVSLLHCESSQPETVKTNVSA